MATRGAVLVLFLTFSWSLAVDEFGGLKYAEPRIKRFISEPQIIVKTPVPTTTTEKISAPTKPTVASKVSKSVQTPEQHTVIGNLGVNGTGQLKPVTVPPNVTLTEAPKGPAVPSPSPSPTTSSAPPEHVSPAVNDSTLHWTVNSDEVGIDNDNVDLDSSEINKTISEHNFTDIKEEYHLYYISTKIDDPEVGQHYWVNLSSDRPHVKVNELLSQSHRRAATIKLSFDFPFYGHPVKNLTIATGGFIYTGDYVHSWLAATQYIAPLMANFDTALSNASFVKYMDNGTALTVEWEKVALKDKPDDGDFTFQATLHKNGDIIFVYKEVPLFIEKIEDHHHPVKVGLSDAYITDRTIFLVRRKTIYEYHRVNFKKEHIKNWTTIYLKALPTCLDFHDCDSCINNNLPNVTCSWCSGIDRCSSGTDRHRQKWVQNSCDKWNASSTETCSNHRPDDEGEHDGLPGSPKRMFSPTEAKYSQDTDDHVMHRRPHSEQVGVSGIIAILFLVTMVMGVSFWIFYAYRNPHTTSGQILIRYRPSQWRWRRGEARYTAATIHM